MKKADRDRKAINEKLTAELEEKKKTGKLTIFDSMAAISRYCLMCKSRRTGKITAYSLAMHRRVEKYSFFTEHECLDIYNAAKEEMKKYPYLQLFIYNSLPVEGQQIWRPHE